MAVEWNAYQGGDANYLSILYDVLKFGTVTDATTDAVTVEYNGQSVVFEGDIILNGGEVQAGMIHNLSVFDGEDLVAEASGYWLDIGVIGNVADEIQAQVGVSYAPLYDMLNMQPVTFNGSPDADTFIGGDFDDTFHGKAGNDWFFGGGGDDLIFGGGGADMLQGSRGDDELRGGSGDDELRGAAGNDLMKGGKGADTFLFLFNPLGAVAGVDHIADFKPDKDIIGLDTDVFTAIGNHLNSGEFHIGGNAADGNDYILYNPNNGKLFYDADGDGAGAKVKFAVLDNVPDLSHDDFMMM